MAVTVENVGKTRDGRPITRHVETGSANTLLTSSVALNVPGRVVLVTVAYSAAPTQAGVTTTLDSGAGAGYDTTLNTGSANARYTVYAPENLVLGDDDALSVAAPAGGVGITASIAVYTEGV